MQHQQQDIPRDDVIVVGAGLAGLTAARTLQHLGLTPLVLEARDRVGGRTWSAECDAVGSRLDLGAEWVAPQHHHAVMSEVARYGLSTVDADFVFSGWELPERRTTSGDPLTPSERVHYTDVMAAMANDAQRIDFQAGDWHRDVLDLDVPFHDYLAALTDDAAVRSVVLIQAFALMGADERDYSALNLLHEFAGFGTPAQAFEGETSRIVGGTASIAEAMAAEVGDVVERRTVVTQLRSLPDGSVQVSSSQGERRARAVIVTVPVNTLAQIDLRLHLPGKARQMIRAGHAGKVNKVWAMVDRLDDGLQSFGWPEAVETYTMSGPSGAAIAGFGVGRSSGPATADAAVLAAVTARHPSLRLREPLWHDWNDDPFSRGTWYCARPGQAEGWFELASVAGPCLFAGGDLSRRWAGWMDGAITSGADAAHRARAFLDGSADAGASG